jgi:hypothetical protein
LNERFTDASLSNLTNLIFLDCEFNSHFTDVSLRNLSKLERITIGITPTFTNEMIDDLKTKGVIVHRLSIEDV